MPRGWNSPALPSCRNWPDIPGRRVWPDPGRAIGSGHGMDSARPGDRCTFQPDGGGTIASRRTGTGIGTGLSYRFYNPAI